MIYTLMWRKTKRKNTAVGKPQNISQKDQAKESVTIESDAGDSEMFLFGGQ